MKLLRLEFLSLLFPFVILVACNETVDLRGKYSQKNGDGTEKAVLLPTYAAAISWKANKETAVNSAGGGYSLSYSKDPSLPAAATTIIKIPWTTGPSAPTIYALKGLLPGTYHFKIQAYSNKGTSEVTDAVSLTVP